jgi:hypothetical protein
MARRLAALGFVWADTTATQVYTVHDFHPFMADVVVRSGAARSGVAWHYARPPVQMLEYEIGLPQRVARDRGLRATACPWPAPRRPRSGCPPR